jgi:hypothetical protein
MVVGLQSSFVSPSPIGYRLSPIGYRLSVIGYRLSVIGYRLSPIGLGPPKRSEPAGAKAPVGYRYFLLEAPACGHGSGGLELLSAARSPA